MLMVCLSGQVGLKIMISWMRHQDRGDNCVARTMWFCETRVQPLNPLLFAFSPAIWPIGTWNGSIKGRRRHLKDTPHFPLWQLLSNWVKHVFVYFANWDRMMIMIIMRRRRMFINVYKCHKTARRRRWQWCVCLCLNRQKPSEVIGTIICGFNAVFSAQSPSQRSANTSFNLLRTYSNLVQQEHQRRFKMLSQLGTKSKIQLTYKQVSSTMIPSLLNNQTEAN